MKLEILSNVILKEDHYLLELSAPQDFKEALPGQFVHCRIEDSCDPLLRRPLSLHDVDFSAKQGLGIVRVLYKAVGRGTQLLASRKPSMSLDVLGPLGKGFDLKTLDTKKKIFIVAGGIGVAPLFFLAKQLAARSSGRPVAGKVVVLVGAKTKEQVLCEKEFKKLGCDVHISTDDGSKGFKGRVTDLLKELLPSTLPAGRQALTICACGPKPMLAVVADLAKKNNCQAQVSLEEFMGCGLGACLGCVIRTTSGYQRICHDGPVFDAGEILWRG
jgi:dihydroorotate dehydrogenase electron transfer subunit